MSDRDKRRDRDKRDRSDRDRSDRRKRKRHSSDRDRDKDRDKYSSSKRYKKEPSKDVERDRKDKVVKRRGKTTIAFSNSNARKKVPQMNIFAQKRIDDKKKSERRKKLKANLAAWKQELATDDKNDGKTDATDKDINGITPMDVDSDKPSESSSEPAEEEIDPLDAFMNNVNKEKTKALQESLKKAEKNEVANRSRTSEILASDDEEEEEDKEKDMMELLPKKLRPKVLEAVNHDEVDYEPFRRNLYVEVPEIANKTEEEVAKHRSKLDNIRIRGTECPNPITTFRQCGLPRKLLQIMDKFGYKKPTPIQAQMLPAVMSGRDVIGIAKTGSGKTLAFLLPMFRHIMDQRKHRAGEGPVGLVIAPTRELATQIHEEVKKFKPASGLASVCVYGGVGVQGQISALKRGVEVVVCTPGRMIDILCANKGRIVNFKRVTYLVLDECDRMFDMGFEPQISRIMQLIRPDRQTVLTSATFPRVVEYAARNILTDPLELTIRGGAMVSNTIQQYVEVLEEDRKFTRLMELITHWYNLGSILVFVDRQEYADYVYGAIQRSGYQALSLHGGKDQMDRHETIANFKKGEKKIMVATSIAARGLDIEGLRLVINYDVPNHLEDYVHRVGRTGRAGKRGTAYTFITNDEERYAGDLVLALKQSKQKIPEALAEMAEAHKIKLDAGLVKKKGSGFTGSGYKFDADEAAAVIADKVKQQEFWDLDGDGVLDETTQRALDHVGKKEEEAKAEAIKKAAEIGEDGDLPLDDLEVNKQEKVEVTLPSGVKVSLPKNMAKPIASPAERAKQQALQQVKPQVDNNDKNLSKKEKMAQAARKAAEFAASLNKRMDLQRVALNASLGVNSQRFTDEMEINDYPQHARWKVTHKDALAQITEVTNCGITARGVYVPPGRPPIPGERKLYLFIEGESTEDVQNAKEEIKTILEEACQTGGRMDLLSGFNKGRYQLTFK